MNVPSATKKPHGGSRRGSFFGLDVRWGMWLGVFDPGKRPRLPPRGDATPMPPGFSLRSTPATPPNQNREQHLFFRKVGKIRLTGELAATTLIFI